MTEKDQPQGFFNNAIVVLLLLFTIPMLLVVGGFVVVALQGRIPGGTTSTCERTLDDRQFRLEVYAYTAGLTPYETQSFYLDDQLLFEDTIQAPDTATCADNMQRLGDHYLLFNQKTVAIINPDGSLHLQQNVCDDPRPEGRCDVDAVNYAQIDVDSPDVLRLRVQESIVDEYGQPLFDSDGERRIIDEYLLSTNDGGQMWTIDTE
jgi:hypothetical protein